VEFGASGFKVEGTTIYESLTTGIICVTEQYDVNEVHERLPLIKQIIYIK
jgi:hypothetical protein